MTQTVINSANSYHNTRIAPTPSGYLHVGNIMSFAITSALAKKHDAKVLLRIDDLDQARADSRYVQEIFDTLNYLDIPWNIGPRNIPEFQDNWSQANRINLYQAAIKKLCDKRAVFACVCSRQQIGAGMPCTCREKRIALDTENASLRLITGSHELKIKTYSGRASEVALPPEMRNFIIRRKDGVPSYQLASVVDDLYYGIDLIVRGEDLLPSTIAQHELASALGEDRFRDITFYHHSLLMEASGKKLSKSTGSTSVKYMRENGKKPSEVYAMIANMLGIECQVNSWDELAGGIMLNSI